LYYNIFVSLKHGIEKNSLTEERRNLELRMVEEMMQLLVVVLSERYQFGVGQVTREQCITNEMIHQLCMGPCPHSKLQDILHRQFVNVDYEPEVDLDPILQSVATYKLVWVL
jgi:E3 ubiquitin-protein ligase UBR2